MTESLTEAVPELRDVRGPSALGGGWRRSLELLYLIASTEFKRTYFGTVLGYLWSLCRPLLLFAVLLAVFTHVIRLGSRSPTIPSCCCSTSSCSGSSRRPRTPPSARSSSQEAVVRKTQFPRLVIPLAVVLTSVFNLLLNLVVVFVFVLGFGVAPMSTWLLLPVLLIWLFILTTAVAMILSSLYPRFRDVGIIWAVFSTALFYATPVLYPLQKVTGTIGTLIAFNPLTPLFELVRKWIIDPAAPVKTGPLYVLVPLLLSVAIVVFAVWIFNREAPRIAEAL